MLGRLLLVIARVYDSRRASGEDFGTGWHLSLAQTITPLVTTVLGLIIQNQDEDFDLSRTISIKHNTPFLMREDGSRYRPENPDEIIDPQVRADYIERAKAMESYVKQYNFEVELRSGWKDWLRSFHLVVQGGQNKNSDSGSP